MSLGCVSPARTLIQGEDTGVAPLPDLLTIADGEDLDTASDALHVSFIAAPHIHEVEDIQYDGYAYNGQTPGPTLRAAVGDTLTVDFTNGLVDTSTIHWHGVSAPVAMDGVQWVTDPVPAGGSFSYTMTLDRAGTFWYHPHIDTNHQVDLGLYGAIVVTDPAEPSFDDDLLLVFDAWAESGDGEGSDEHGLFDPGDFPWTVNGVVDPLWATSTSRSLRARLVNVSNTSYLDLVWPGAVRIAGDQGVIGISDTPDHLLLAPGDRMEIAWAPVAGETEIVTHVYVPAGGQSWQPDVRVLTITAEDDGAASLPDLSTGQAAPTDPGTTDLTYVFAGGTTDGDDGWLINGESWPDVTIQTVPLGATTIIEVRNLSGTEHPFHLHGNPFEVLSLDGVPPASMELQDTVNVPIRSVLRVRLTPDNPGDWMLHCHLLGHEEGGMMTVLRVE